MQHMQSCLTCMENAVSLSHISHCCININKYIQMSRRYLPFRGMRYYINARRWYAVNWSIGPSRNRIDWATLRRKNNPPRRFVFMYSAVKPLERKWILFNAHKKREILPITNRPLQGRRRVSVYTDRKFIYALCKNRARHRRPQTNA